VLITHALKITSVKNRRKRLWAEHNKTKLKEIEEKHKEGDKDERIARLKRATLGYVPKSFVSRFRELARKTKKEDNEINLAIEKINTMIVQHNYKLYGRWLKENRKMRKAEGTDMKRTYIHNRFTKERHKSIKQWSKDDG
jgi:hypothetical protein